MVNLQELADELTNDPLTRGYSGMNDQAAADDLNLLLYSGPSNVEAVFTYLALETRRTNNGSDTVASSLLGRIRSVASETIGQNMHGGTRACDWIHRTTCQGFLEIINSPLFGQFDFTDSRMGDDTIGMLQGLVDAQCIGSGDRTAIMALSQNLRARGEVLGFGRVTHSDIINARALP